MARLPYELVRRARLEGNRGDGICGSRFRSPTPPTSPLRGEDGRIAPYESSGAGTKLQGIDRTKDVFE